MTTLTVWKGVLRTHWPGIYRYNTGIYRRYIPVYTEIPVYTDGKYRYLSKYRYIPTIFWYIPVYTGFCIPTVYTGIPVYTGIYRYISVYTGIYRNTGIYRRYIPSVYTEIPVFKIPSVYTVGIYRYISVFHVKIPVYTDFQKVAFELQEKNEDMYRGISEQIQNVLPFQSIESAESNLWSNEIWQSSVTAFVWHSSYVTRTVRHKSTLFWKEQL